MRFQGCGLRLCRAQTRWESDGIRESEDAHLPLHSSDSRVYGIGQPVTAVGLEG
jgi:hypothetical protein